MTQEERWLAQWQEIMGFMEEYHRRPSKFVDEERGMRNWWKHQQKLMNAGAAMCCTAVAVPWGRMVALDAQGQGPGSGYVALTGLDGIGFPDGHGRAPTLIYWPLAGADDVGFADG